MWLFNAHEPSGAHVSSLDANWIRRPATAVGQCGKCPCVPPAWKLTAPKGFGELENQFAGEFILFRLNAPLVVEVEELSPLQPVECLWVARPLKECGFPGPNPFSPGTTATVPPWLLWYGSHGNGGYRGWGATPGFPNWIFDRSDSVGYTYVPYKRVYADSKEAGADTDPWAFFRCTGRNRLVAHNQERFADGSPLHPYKNIAVTIEPWWP